MGGASHLARVNDELAIAANGNEPAVAIVHELLREDLSAAQVSQLNRDLLPVLHIMPLDRAGANLTVLPDHELPTRVHTSDRIIIPELNNNTTLIVPNRNLATPLAARKGPRALHPVIKRRLGAVRGRGPNANRPVLTGRAYDRELRVEHDRAHVVRVPVQRLHDALRLVVPDLHRLVVRAGEEVRLVAGGVVVDAVHAALVTLEGVVRRVGAQAPDLDGAVERGGGEGISVLGVQLDLHDVVRVSLKRLRVSESLVPVPQLDGHVVGGGEDVGEGGVNFHAADVIGVRLEVGDLLHSVKVVYAEVHVVRRSDEPLFPRDELGASDGEVAEIEGLGEGGRLVVPEEDLAGVEGGKGPGLGGVDVDGLDALRASRELLLDVQAERLGGEEG